MGMKLFILCFFISFDFCETKINFPLDFPPLSLVFMSTFSLPGLLPVGHKYLLSFSLGIRTEILYPLNLYW